MRLIHYREKCVCGAEIEIEDEYDLFPHIDAKTQISEWKISHSSCSILFSDIQKIRMEKIIHDIKYLSPASQLIES